MKLAFSSLAWNASDDAAVATLLRDAGFAGIELAPTKLWPDLTSVSATEISRVREFWSGEGLPVVATQAILFGRSDLQLFGTVDQRRDFEHFIGKAIKLTSSLGAEVVVFGAPGNRKKGQLTDREASDIAVPLLYRIGELAADSGVMFCIEPNPPEYGCDWIVNAAEGRRLVALVGSRGFKLHLDAGALSMTSAAPSADIEESIEVLCHFHVSEPQLRPVGEPRIDHRQFAATLSRSRYAGWCSVEMRQPSSAEDLASAAAFTRRTYGEGEDLLP